MPDIDVDFCFERRGEVIEYVRQRYGRDSVGQIVTFGTMKARAAVKDVARVLKIPPGEADKLTKLIPSGPAFSLTIPEAVQKVDELRELVKGNPLVRAADGPERPDRGDLAPPVGARRRRGHRAGPAARVRAGLHGADQGRRRSPRTAKTSMITQYEMGALEKVGMLKMDILGLKTLTVIHDAVDMIRDRHGVALDMRHAAVRRPGGLRARCAQGRTAGVFQFESALATETLRAMQCDRFDDLVAIERPAPPRPARRRDAHGVHPAEARARRRSPTRTRR